MDILLYHVLAVEVGDSGFPLRATYRAIDIMLDSGRFACVSKALTLTDLAFNAILPEVEYAECTVSALHGLID